MIQIMITKMRTIPIMPVQIPALKIPPITSQPETNTEIIKSTDNTSHALFFIFFSLKLINK